MVSCPLARSLPLIALILALHAPAAPAADAAGDDPALATALAELIVPLPDTSPLDWTDADLAWLDGYADTRVLAIGEASHGGREFTAARHRILRYLVERHGYRALVMESHYTESLLLGDCLDSPDCDLAASMGEAMLFWTTRTAEMLAALNWIRERNLGRPEQEKVRFLGFDSQVRDQIPDLFQAILDPVRPELGERFRCALAALDTLTRSDYQAMTDQERAARDQALADLEQDLAAAGLAPVLGAYRTACTRQLVTAARQSLEFLQQYFRHGRLVRDRHLFENVQWILSLLGSDAKVVLWAHNAHVAVDPAYARDAGGNLGSRLRGTLGDGYRCLGLTFNQGEFRAKTLNADGAPSAEPELVALAVEPPADSLNRLLATPEPARFFLDLHRLPAASPLARWLDQPRPVLGVGDLFLGYDKLAEYHYGGDRIVNVRQAFDGIVHLGRTHAVTLLPGPGR